MSGLADVLTAALAEQRASRPRTVQQEIGPSQADGCRAAHVLQLAGVPESDPRLSWQAEVGSAIHELVLPLLGKALDAEIEVPLTFRGMPCHADLIGPPLLLDLKTTSADGLVKRRAYGPKPAHVAQVQLYAAAALDAGYDIRTVAILYVPRDGDLTDAVEWLGTPDRAAADAAWERVAESGRIAAERAGAEPAGLVAGLRDEPWHFCSSYCGWFTVCREPVDGPVGLVDEPGREAAEAYRTVKARVAADEATLRGLRETLARYEDLRSVGYVWRESKGRSTPDVEAIRFLLGGPLPMREGAPVRSLVPVKPVPSADGGLCDPAGVVAPSGLLPDGDRG